MHVAFDAWLIRPLREKSLIDVLCGRLRGIERRDAINDNHPDVGFSSRVVERASGIEVLVAEDDAVNQRIIRAVLEKAAISSAPSGILRPCGNLWSRAYPVCLIS